MCTLRLFTRSTWPEGLDLSSPIVLNFPLLLDRPSPRLPGIKIVAGGRLVFSPHAADASLTTDFIQVAVFVVVVPLSSFVQIEDGGSLEIGSSECPFEGRAEILLTGRKRPFFQLHNGNVDCRQTWKVRDGQWREIHRCGGGRQAGDPRTPTQVVKQKRMRLTGILKIMSKLVR